MFIKKISQSTCQHQISLKKNVKELFNANTYSDASFGSFGKGRCLVQSYSLIQFGWKLSKNVMEDHLEDHI